MSNRQFVSDTHPLLHYFCSSNRKLSLKVKQIFDDCIYNGKSAIYVPAAVLLEISILIQSGKIQISEFYGDWIDALFANQMVNPAPFDHETAKLVHHLNFNSDLFDKSIVATALQLDLPLITNDSKIHENKPCLLVWT
ncbi:MAG: type II toxin-antitoxin system VapC family toxin [Cyanobacteria bacterium TGS_CYA1]|nr:type II toxin-antitoxin system VapC family toxin [Cyanobacteria bacterium TGS_CYA1]